MAVLRGRSWTQLCHVILQEAEKFCSYYYFTPLQQVKKMAM
jgi:hypothetical protein